MDVHNSRSPEQWEIISKHVDFTGKTVIDLGCGYGDIARMAHEAGAEFVYGVDGNPDIIDRLTKADNPVDGFMFAVGKIENLTGGAYDISICFSVLPYLSDPDSVLRWMRYHSGIALIECQYHGDGPGPERLKNDGDMRRWLRRVGWQGVEPIGKTYIDGRDKYRTIWMCQ